MAKQNKVSAQPAQRPTASEQWSIYRKLSWWSLLALVFLTPIAMSNLTFLGFDLPITFDQFDILKLFLQRVFGLAALAFWAWDMALHGGKIRRTPVDWLILAFIAWVALSAVLSIHPPTAVFGKYRRFEGLLSFINYAVIYFLVLQYADRPSRVRVLAQTLFWSGVLVAGYGVLQSLGRDFVAWGRLPFEVNRAFSTFGNPDLLGGFLMFSVFVSLGLALAEERLVWRAVYWTGFLLNMWCVVVAFTRSAWVGGLVGFTFFVILAVRQRVSWKAVDWGFAGAVGALVTAVIVRSLANPNEVMNFGKRLASIFKFGEGSARTRFEIWQAAIDAIKARPVFGFGADTFRLVFPKYKPFEYARDAGYLSVADNVHNYPLQLAAGIGIPGMLMLYAIVAWAAIRSWPTVFAREGSANRMILVGFWTACAAYVTHLFFGLSVTGSSFLLWTSMAVVLAPTATFVEVKRPNWGIVVAVAVTALVLFGVVFQIRFIMADNAYLMARIGTAGQGRTAAALRAVQLNPYNDIYRAEVGLSYVDELTNALSIVSQGGDQQLLEVARTAFAGAESSFKQTIDFVPWEYDNYVFLANLYNLGGQVYGTDYYKQALEVAKQGIVVERFGPAIRLQHARALDATGDSDAAVKELEYALELDPKYTEASLMLAILFEGKGNYPEAIRVLKAAQVANPSAPGVADELARIEASATAAP